jgi:hypothetical protein
LTDDTTTASPATSAGASAALRQAASAHPLLPLHDPRTIRVRCAAILAAVDRNVSGHFTVDRAALPALAERVAALTRRRFPDLQIPLHSRWRHFEAGGVDRKPVLDALLAGRSAADAARARFDLTVVSVLLDAGAGPGWQYLESQVPGQAASPSNEAGEARVFTRSEGLGVASWHAFLGGSFSASANDPLRVDAAALVKMDAAALRTVFQVNPNNVLVGLEGRAGLLARLGAALGAESARNDQAARPALLFDLATACGARQEVAADALLGLVLRVLGPIWTSGSRVQGLPAGDVWAHRWAGDGVGGGGHDPTTGGWVPFHKLSQWLVYSLVEPLQWAGVRVTGLEQLTGLPEYRNGGLLIDAGVIVPRHRSSLARQWSVGDDYVIEWRALTVALLDELALQVRERLGPAAADLPLACILEGGTWAAGRELARELRPDGTPPLRINSDGTVF